MEGRSGFQQTPNTEPTQEVQPTVTIDKELNSDTTINGFIDNPEIKDLNEYLSSSMEIYPFGERGIDKNDFSDFLSQRSISNLLNQKTRYGEQTFSELVADYSLRKDAKEKLQKEAEATALKKKDEINNKPEKAEKSNLNKRLNYVNAKLALLTSKIRGLMNSGSEQALSQLEAEKTQYEREQTLLEKTYNDRFENAG